MPTLEDFQNMLAQNEQEKLQESSLYRKIQAAELARQKAEQEGQGQPMIDPFIKSIFDNVASQKRIKQYEDDYRQMFAYGGGVNSAYSGYIPYACGGRMNKYEYGGNYESENDNNNDNIKYTYTYDGEPPIIYPTEDTYELSKWFQKTFPHPGIRNSLYNYISDNTILDRPVNEALHKFKDLYMLSGNPKTTFNMFADRSFAGIPGVILIDRTDNDNNGYGNAVVDELAHKSSWNLGKHPASGNDAFGYDTGNLGDWQAYPGYEDPISGDYSNYGFPGSSEYNTHVVREPLYNSYWSGARPIDSYYSDPYYLGGVWMENNKSKFEKPVNSIEELIKRTDELSRSASRYGIDLYNNYTKSKDTQPYTNGGYHDPKISDLWNYGTIRNKFPFSIIDKELKRIGIFNAEQIMDSRELMDSHEQ